MMDVVLFTMAANPTAALLESTPRLTYSLDSRWKFQREGESPIKPCARGTWIVDLTGQQTTGLSSAGAITEERCAMECCADQECATYQFCNSSKCGSGPPQQPTCMLGSYTAARTHPSSGWIGKARTLPPAPPVPNGTTAQCGEAWCKSATDDSAWRTLDVPHDFVVEGNFSRDADMAHGYLPFGVGYYRKRLVLPPRARAALRAGTHLASIVFDGVQAQASVYFGGRLCATHASGYTPFKFYLAPSQVAALLDGGPDALLAVRVDARKPDGWWYDGGGIYRHVRLVLLPTVHLGHVSAPWTSHPGRAACPRHTTMASSALVPTLIVPHIEPRCGQDGGVYLPSAVTGPIDRDAQVADATLSPRVSVASFSTSPVRFRVECLLRNETTRAVLGRTAVEGVVPAASDPASGHGNSTNVSPPPIVLRQAHVWSPESPALYAVETILTTLGYEPKEAPTSADTPAASIAPAAVAASSCTDTASHAVGFRKAEWDPDHGFSLNGVRRKILGAANHQDFAGVGVAVPDALQAHRVSRLKSIGIDGWRTAHNAPTPALLDAADRLGMLVWDENHRNGQDDELRRLVQRDFNHPSVIIWSICNEILCKRGANATRSLADGHRMHALFHALDPGSDRVVSANYNDWIIPDTPLDLIGVDYHTQRYDDVHRGSPTVPIISSETSSAVSDRGEYSNNRSSGHVSGYDVNAPSWGQTAEAAWGGVGEPAGQGILTRPFVSGGWTWTGFDYKGEPTPYAWPDINSHFGILDMVGFAKDRAYWYETHFKQFAPGEGSVHLFPHWNWMPHANGSATAGRTDSATAHTQAHLAPCRGPCHPSVFGGADVDVWAYTNAASVELFVNGVSHGKVRVANFSHAQWLAVPYVPGELRAVASDAAGQTIAVHSVSTTQPAHSLRLSFKDDVGNSTADGHGGGIVAGCRDVALVMVEVVDAAGHLVPIASPLVTLSHAGTAAVFAGGGNGDPADHTPDKSSTRRAFHGLLLGVYISTNTVGRVVVRASSPGLAAAELTIAVAAPAFTTKWWCSRLPQI